MSDIVMVFKRIFGVPPKTVREFSEKPGEFSNLIINEQKTYMRFTHFENGWGELAVFMDGQSELVLFLEAVDGFRLKVLKIIENEIVDLTKQYIPEIEIFRAFSEHTKIKFSKNAPRGPGYKLPKNKNEDIVIVIPPFENNAEVLLGKLRLLDGKFVYVKPPRINL